MSATPGPGAKSPGARRARRAVDRITAALGFRESGCHNAPRFACFLVGTALAGLGLSKRRILVMNCNDTSDNTLDGFYAQFTVILGLLEHFERWGRVVAGVRVDFGDHGLYYDPAHGGNSWEHHFQPVDIGRESKTIEARIDVEQYECFRLRGESMPRARAFDLIGRYIHVKPHIREKVEAYVRTHFEGFHVIGVHYRGTDKRTEAPLVPYDECRAAVGDAVGAAGTGDIRLFVASDEQTFVDCMASAFPGKVVFWETLRSLDGTPIDLRMENNFKKGEDAVIDCLLLSHCHSLIRTPSNLGLCSTFINPCIPVLLLNQSHSEARTSTG